jgi:hypothetical protein
MAVYVDQEQNSFRRMVMCHMFAESIAELHEMAKRIGMRKEWFQPLSFPHYDVAKGRRAAALRLGAVEVDRRQGAAIRKRLRTDPAFVAEWMEETKHLRN